MSVPGGTQAAGRIYYDDPACMAFTATVTAIREVARVEGRQVWQIALDRTAFYPTGGGQPFDTGTLIATARSGASLEAHITEVEEDSSGEVWHTTHKPLQEGTPVQGIVDRDRRRDHMQQHSGQHLLSAILYRDLQARTVSFHLGSEQSTIDLACASLSDENLAQVERSVNEAIRQTLPVSVRYASPDEANDLLQRGVLRKLPPRSGRMRLIEIAGLDLNACGGTHVENTAAIAPLLLRGTERVRDTVRLAFLCGDRAVSAARGDFTQLRSLAHSLSTGTDGLTGTVARLQAESRAAAKEHALLLRSLAEAEALSLAAAAEQAGSSLVHHTLQAQGAACGAVYAKLLASSLIATASVHIALVAAPEDDRCSVVLAAKPGTLDCGLLLRTELAVCGGRGGGDRNMAQGSLPQSQLSRFFDVVSRILSPEALHIAGGGAAVFA